MFLNAKTAESVLTNKSVFGAIEGGVCSADESSLSLFMMSRSLYSFYVFSWSKFLDVGI